MLQPFFRRLHSFALAGLNYGTGADAGDSDETVTLRYVRDVVPAGRTAVLFDVGANSGAYCREVLDHVSPPLVLHAFEPSPAAFAQLRGAMRGRREVALHNVGMGDERGSAVLYGDRGGSELGSLYDRRLEVWSMEIAVREQVEIHRLDEFCLEHGIERIHLLKIDVEGHELSVLRGSGSLLAERRIDLVQFEFAWPAVAARLFFYDLFELLHPNYRIHRILSDGLVAIDTYEARHEIFLTTNYLAVSRDIDLPLRPRRRQ